MGIEPTVQISTGLASRLETQGFLYFYDQIIFKVHSADFKVDLAQMNFNNKKVYFFYGLLAFFIRAFYCLWKLIFAYALSKIALLYIIHLEFEDLGIFAFRFEKEVNLNSCNVIFEVVYFYSKLSIASILFCLKIDSSIYFVFSSDLIIPIYSLKLNNYSHFYYQLLKN